MGKAKDRITATVSHLDKLYEDGDIGTYAYGGLLISLGAREHLAAHSDEEDHDDERVWREATGKVWSLVGGTEGWVFTEYVDALGGVWTWAGGFRWDPDKQPMMSRRDFSERDVPLNRVIAAVGPLQAIDVDKPVLGSSAGRRASV